MDRPRTSHGHHERRSIASLWRPKTGVDLRHLRHEDSGLNMSSAPDSTSNTRQHTLERSRAEQMGDLRQEFGSSSHEQAGQEFASNRFQEWLSNRLLSEPTAGLSSSEPKSLGWRGSRRLRLPSFFTHRPKDLFTEQEEEPSQIRQTQPTSWLRRAKSTTLRFGKKPLYEEHEQQETSHFGELNIDAPLARGLSVVRGGAAARAAAAAASRDRLESFRSPVLREVSKLKDFDPNADSESGIGIDLKDALEDEPEAISCARRDPAMLPPELFEQIISYLDAASVMSAELVSHKWLVTASSYPVWRNIFGSEVEPKRPVVPDHVGGLGVGNGQKKQDWKQMWRVKKALDARWQDGHAAAIYLEGHKDSVYCVQFDESKIVTGSRDRTIRVWDARTYKCIKVLGIPKTSTSNLLLQPVGDRMNRQKPFKSVNPPRPLDTDVRAITGPINHHGSVLCLQFDETTMVTGSSDTTLIIWDLTQDYKPTHSLQRHSAGVLDVCFDKDHIVSCSKDTMICLWERSTGNLIRTFNGHRGPVNAVQLRGNHIVSASGDGIAKLWNVASGNCVKEFPSKDRGLACVEFSPDSRTILAGGNDQVIYQFGANTGELTREIAGHSGLVRSLHLDSVNNRVISGSYDYSVKAFDAESGKMICDFAGWTTSWILSAKADYRRIVATSQDGRVVVMDLGYDLKGIELLEA